MVGNDDRIDKPTGLLRELKLELGHPIANDYLVAINEAAFKERLFSALR